MTSSAIIQAAASTRTAPSREFMVQQAVLNAAAKMYPSAPHLYLKTMGGLLVKDRPFYTIDFFVKPVRAEYARIAAQYQVAA